MLDLEHRRATLSQMLIMLHVLQQDEIKKCTSVALVLRHSPAIPQLCYVDFDLLPAKTSNTHTFFPKHTDTHAQILCPLHCLPKPGQAFHGRPQTLLCRCRVTSASDINTHTHTLRASLPVRVCSQTDLASSLGARRTAHNTH